MSVSAPSHRFIEAPKLRFKQPDGARYPSVRPDGLVYQKQLRELLGIAETTLLRWQKLGWITPERKEAHLTLYRPPTQERIEEIRAMMAEREVAGAARGRRTQMTQGSHSDRTKRSQEVRVRRAQERADQGLVSKRTLAKLTKTNCATINDWIKTGIITPALVSVSGKQMWFTHSDIDTIKSFTIKPQATVKTKPTPKLKPAQKTKPALKTKPVPPVEVVVQHIAKVKAVPTVEVGSYADAVAQGRSDSRFQTALGFNLLAHPQLGFRPALVNEKPDQGWRYHERHFINGYRQWQVKAQKALTGEIVL